MKKKLFPIPRNFRKSFSLTPMGVFGSAVPSSEKIQNRLRSPSVYFILNEYFYISPLRTQIFLWGEFLLGFLERKMMSPGEKK